MQDRFKSLLPKSKTKIELDEHYDKIQLEKGDFPAMVIAALITFLPILAVSMFVIYGLIWLFFS
ncbi:MAG: hypothetical protein FWG88_09180 [Oscillospiraceae bacterium]|nr:hypothetical protein [Oscillospiraceae bacterium]